MSALQPIIADLRLGSLGRAALICFALALPITGAGTAAKASDTAASGNGVEVEPESPATSQPIDEVNPACGCCQRGKGKGRDSGGGKGAGCGMGRGKGAGDNSAGAGRGHAGRPEMQLAHFLIDNHARVKREVEMIPAGVRTSTTTEDPELTESLREHVRQMANLIREGGRIRNWDPLFQEIFERRDAIHMEINDIEGGVEVIETSEDSQVALLIQAHARKVDDFVARGRAAYREETPLPEGYSETRP
jgi:hypothetical protein